MQVMTKPSNKVESTNRAMTGANNAIRLGRTMTDMRVVDE